jgi:hypothetical protein
MHVHPYRFGHTLLLHVVDDAEVQVGKRHRRIRARSATGSVAGAASEYSGLAAHQPKHGLPILRSPRTPLVR